MGYNLRSTLRSVDFAKGSKYCFEGVYSQTVASVDCLDGDGDKQKNTTTSLEAHEDDLPAVPRNRPTQSSSQREEQSDSIPDLVHRHGGA
jgi:hypothetical protein